MRWIYVNLFELFLCDTGSGERKIRAQTRPRKKIGSRECKNKQLDPGNENYVNHFGQSSPETGSRKRKIRFQTRPGKGNGYGESKISN